MRIMALGGLAPTTDPVIIKGLVVNGNFGSYIVLCLIMSALQFKQILDEVHKKLIVASIPQV